MKHLIISLIFSSLIFPQGEETFPDNELAIKIKNAPNKTITFELIPIGSNWALYDDCDFWIFNDNNTYTSSLTANSTGYVDCDYNGFEYRLYNEVIILMYLVVPSQLQG